MRAGLVVIAAACAAMLSACGQDSQACFTNEIGVKPGDLRGGCDAPLAANSPLTIDLNLCPTCAQSSARCDGDVQGNTVFLDSKVNECEEAKGCDVTSCLASPVSCPLNAKLSAGSYTVIYLTAGGSRATTTVQVAPSGASSCTL